MTFEDRSLIEELLQDETLSYRAIARQLDGDPRPLKSPRSRSDDGDDDVEPLGLGGWAVLVGIAALFIGAIWLWGRGIPPPDA